MVARQREIERELRLDGMGEVRQDIGSLDTAADEEFDDGDDEPDFEEELAAAA
jgi:hypothetical protein